MTLAEVETLQTLLNAGQRIGWENGMGSVRPIVSIDDRHHALFSAGLIDLLVTPVEKIWLMENFRCPVLDSPDVVITPADVSVQTAD